MNIGDFAARFKPCYFIIIIMSRSVLELTCKGVQRQTQKCKVSPPKVGSISKHM